MNINIPLYTEKKKKQRDPQGLPVAAYRAKI